MSLTDVKARLDTLVKLLELSDDPDRSVVTELKEISALLSAEGAATAHVAKEEDTVVIERPAPGHEHDEVPPPVDVEDEKDEYEDK